MVFRRQVDVAALDAADRAGSDHPGIVRTRIEAHRQRMGEIFKERDVGKAGDHTPRARGRIAKHRAVRNPISAVPAKGRGAPAGRQRGQAFRAVHRIGIVAGAVPGDEAGGHVVELVLGNTGKQPALPGQILPVGRLAPVGLAVSEIKGEAQRIKRRQLSADAKPPCRVVRIFGHDGNAVLPIGKQADNQGFAVLAHFIQAVLAEIAVHAPRVELPAFPGQRDAQAHKVHRVAHAAVNRGVVVFRTHPEQGHPGHIIELIGQGDARAVRVVAPHDGIASYEVRQAERLQAHADAQIRLGHNPIHVRVPDFDDLAVRSERAAFTAVAPIGVPDFKEHRTLQGFGRDDVHLRAQALAGMEQIVGLFLGEADIVPFGVEIPFSRNLDVGGLRTLVRRAENKPCCQKKDGYFLHAAS